jgi:hypothetical protein
VTLLLFFVPFVGITCQHGSPCCGAVGFSFWFLEGGRGLEAACESGKKRLKGNQRGGRGAVAAIGVWLLVDGSLKTGVFVSSFEERLGR